MKGKIIADLQKYNLFNTGGPFLTSPNNIFFYKNAETENTYKKIQNALLRIILNF